MMKHIIHIAECSLRAKCGHDPNLQIRVSGRRAIGGNQGDVTHPHPAEVSDFDAFLRIYHPLS